MSRRIVSGTAKLGLAAVAALALTALSQSAAAQGAAPAAAAPAAADPAKLAKGKQLFADFGCGSCHSLADSGATGHVGPSFDGNANLTPAFIVNRVTNGTGPMPAFGDQMSQDDIAAVAAYIMSSKK